MNEQINLRLPPELLLRARGRAKQMGFGTVQAYIEQAVRQDLYERLTPNESALLRKLITSTEEKRLFGTEKDLSKALGRNVSGKPARSDK